MRRVAALGTALALIMSVWVVMPAQALAPSLHFTADALPTWQTNGTVWSMAVADGKVYAGGSFTQVRPPGTAEGDAASLNRAQLVVLDAATGNPTSCVLDVTRGTTAAVVRAVVTSPDLKTVYIGGLFEKVGTSSRKNIAAIDVATCTVKPFNPQPSSFVYAITATAGSVYFGGTFTTLGTTVTRSRLGAATPDGVILPWAPTTDDEVLALNTDPNNGNVIIGGRSGTINGQDSHALGIVDGLDGTTNIKNYPKGFFPWTPGTGQRTGTSVVKTIAVDATGFYVGNEGTGGGIFDGRAAFDWGTYNQRWRKLCLGATQSIAPVDGFLYAASHGHNCEADGGFEDGARHFFNAETAATKENQPWWPQANDGIGEGIGPRAIVEASTAAGDFLWTGGEFTLINGVAQRGLARFGQGPDTGAPATPQTPNAVSTTPGQATITWRTTLDTDDKTLTYTLYRGTSATAIATLQADSQFYSRSQLSFTDTGLTPGATYQYRVKASDGTNVSAYSLSRSVTVASSAAPYPSKITADGATVYFRMEDPNGTAAGSLGSGPLGGSYVNASTRAGQEGALVGSADTSASFDGVSSFLRTEVSTPAPTVYSIETWFKTTSTVGGKLVGYGNRAMMNAGTPIPLSSQFDRHIYMTNDGRVFFGVNSGSLTTISSAAGLNNGQWHQVVATQGPAGMALYVDGLRVAKNAVTGAQAFSGFWRIGGDNLANWPSRPTSNYFAGNIDETAIYDKPLTTAQVADHFRLSGRSNPAIPAAPTDSYGAAVYADSPDLYWRLGEASGTGAVDASGNNQAGTYAASVTRGVASAVAGTTDTAISTNGAASGIVSSAVSTGAPAALSEELWFKTASTTGGKLIGFGNSQAGASTSYDKHIYLGTDGKLRFGVNSGGLQVITSPLAYNNNAWHHVVATQDGSGTKLYVDGALVVSGTATTNQSFTGFWRIGGDNLSGWPSRPTTDYLTGSIDEAAVYTRALTAAQVQTHYALGTNGTPPDSQAPSVPGGLAASAAAGTVNLSWTPSTDNVAVTGYQVHRSATSGFTPSQATKVADVTTGTTYADAGRPAGTWYYKVVAVDAVGNASAGSIEASAAVADAQAPTAPTSLAAIVTAQTAAVSWTASTDNVGVTGYQVHRSTTLGFTPSPATKIADVTSGTAYSDAGLAGGTYYFRVIAVDAAGNPSPLSNEASATVAAAADGQPPTAPSGVSATAASGNVTVTWTASSDNVKVTGYQVHRSPTLGFSPSPATKIADVTTGNTYTDSGRPIGNWYYRVVAVDAAGNASVASAEAAAAVVDSVAPSAPTGVGTTVANQDVSLTWTASNDNVAVTGYEVHRSATLGFTASSTTKIATVTSGTSFTDTVVTGGTWYYRVVALDAAGNSSAASAQATAVVAAPADGQAPTTPAGLTAAVSGTTVALTWTASTDNVGVAGYDVHRSDTTGFTPDATTKIGTVSAGTTYTDAARPVGTWYYKVVAVDGTGNSSAASVQATAVVSGGAVQTVVLSPTEDTYAVQASPTMNYAATASMASRGGTSSYAAYLKFALPTAPAGTTLVGATFSVKTTTDTFAGSVDSHLVSLAPSAWTDTTLTWNSRPAIGASIGSFAPTTLPNTRYNAILTASALSGLPAGPVTLAVSSTSTDNLWFWSQNHSAVSFRPTLTLTYQAN